ncbi:hypothetical protein [Streptomyces sp. PsTaAH-124]|uniref:hypothetical protein n=1 Tax=Streptomyces sp. PsTaAH-124 TaxID=1157638 RepID=UPI00131A3FC0|nr:hypothetical protein [Streptomyces sp. PsTaAH-124]
MQVTRDTLTEENATHLAVGIIGEPLELKVHVYWRANEKGALIVLSDLETSKEYGRWAGKSLDPMPGESLASAVLDSFVGATLGVHAVQGCGWTTDPVSLAAFFSDEWGWNWVPERLA